MAALFSTGGPHTADRELRSIGSRTAFPSTDSHFPVKQHCTQRGESRERFPMADVTAERLSASAVPSSTVPLSPV